MDIDKIIDFAWIVLWILFALIFSGLGIALLIYTVVFLVNQHFWESIMCFIGFMIVGFFSFVLIAITVDEIQWFGRIYLLTGYFL